MIDIFDIIAFAVFAILIAAALVVIVGMGVLPGRIAQRRGHPQAAAINVAGWLGVATLGLLWPLALIWAFTKPQIGSAPAETMTQTPDRALAQLEARVATLERALPALQSRKEAG